MTKPMLEAVFLDSREPPHIQSQRFGDVPTCVAMLDCGDLQAVTSDECTLVVERKTPDDLLNSIQDGRLLPQAVALRQRSPWCYLVITGNMSYNSDGHVIADHRRTAWRWDSLQGALLTVQELGVGVLTCRGEWDFGDAVCRLARRERDIQILEPRLSSRLLTPGEQILASLPGIGFTRAQLLLNEFHGNAAQALCWLTWLGTVYEIDGIGERTKAKIREALGLAPDQWLSVHDPVASAYASEHQLQAEVTP